MRVILAGQKAFGAAALQAITNAGHDVAAVWSPGDQPGMGGASGPSLDRTTNMARGRNLWVPPMERVPEAVRMLEADLFVAAHSHDFISRASRAATRLGGVGYHPSLLPRHRGRDAVRWTIKMGDPITGGSVYWLTDNVDGGPIAAQDWCHVLPGVVGRNGLDWATSWLWRDYLFPMGIRLLLKVLKQLDEGVIVEVPQDERYATWEPSWERPPLHRPDLPQIGAVNGFKHEVTEDALH